MDLENNNTLGNLQGQLISGRGSPNYFLIYLGFLIFCPLFYIIYRFIKLLCFPVNSSTSVGAMALPPTEQHGDNSSSTGVYVIGMDWIESIIIQNLEMTVERESGHCITVGSLATTPNESSTLWPSCVLLPNQISKTCPTYGELYDLDSPPPTYEEWEAKNVSSPIPGTTEAPPIGKAFNTFSRFKLEQLYRNCIYFAFYMFYRLKNLI